MHHGENDRKNYGCSIGVLSDLIFSFFFCQVEAPQAKYECPRLKNAAKVRCEQAKVPKAEQECLRTDGVLNAKGECLRL